MLYSACDNENIRLFRKDASILLERMKFVESRQLECEITIVRTTLNLLNNKHNNTCLNECYTWEAISLRVAKVKNIVLTNT
jgi:hypothetical protein